MSMITEFYLAVAVGLIISVAMEEYLGITPAASLWRAILP